MATNEKLDFVRKNENGTIQYYVPPQTSKLLSDNWMDILLSGSYAGFDTEKNVLILERIINWITTDDDIILDSFAGSGTTAHAVLNANMVDDGNRKFILVELMDYANDITAERVKRVISGYGESKKVVEGTGGDFSFYELGEPIFKGEELNPAVPIDKIREYIWYTESRFPYKESGSELLGTDNSVAYYFFYEPDGVTHLSVETLSKIKEKAERYVIYADVCDIADDELLRLNIMFKKIPRDISRV